MKDEILGIAIPTDTKKEILEKILKSTTERKDHYHVYSLNPEIFSLTFDNPDYRKAVKWAWMTHIDGVGVWIVAKLLGIRTGDRFPGVDIMDEVIKQASQRSLSVMLIGGKENVAESLADCYHTRYSSLNVHGFQGIQDINNPSPKELRSLFAIVADIKPHIIFVAFGSPAQELWMYKHREKLKGIVCLGVGGSFDFLSGKVPRAPRFLRAVGLEWLYRLIREPWRWRRQLRILRFLYLVFMDKRGYKSQNTE